MELIINTPTYRSTHLIVWLEVNTATGNYVIQKGHAPAIMVLSPQKTLTFRLKTGKKVTVMVKHGAVHITRGTTIVVMTVTEE